MWLEGGPHLKGATRVLALQVVVVVVAVAVAAAVGDVVVFVGITIV